MDAAQLEALQKCIEELENKNKCLSEERASLEKELDKSNRKCNAQASTIEYTQKLLEGVEAHACALTEGNRKLLRKNSALEAALFLAKI
jgi:peptidoglycan hydrolase CwlO-like protein